MAARKPLVIVAGSVQELPTGDTVVGGGDVTLTGTQTLTNKTLTSPVINGFSGTGNGTVTGNLTVTGNTTLGDSAADTVTINASRITGDFSNATLVNRLHLQTSTLNAVTSVGILPNGTAQTAQINVENNSDPANGQYAQFIIGGSSVDLISNARGASIGNALPISISMAGVIAATFNANGTTSNLKVTELNGGPLAGFRNRIINGGFDVWQYASSTTSVNGYKCADRWYLDGGGTCTSAKSATPSSPSGNYYLQITYGAASSYMNLGQAPESSTVFKMRGQAFTAWCWIKSTGTAYTGYISLAASYSNSTDAYASQGTAVSLTINTVVTPTTSWQRALITFTVPADAVGLKIYANNSVAQASGAILHIGDFQLEPGTVATPFENIDVNTRLWQCRRFYRVYSTAQNVANLAYEMRATPTQAGAGPYTYSIEL